MITNQAASTKAADHLSVIHKAPPTHSVELYHFHDAVIQTDLNLHITGWNPAAEKMHGQPGAMGKHLFELADIKFIDSSIQQLKADLKADSAWNGEVIFTRTDGQTLHLRAAANYIINELEQPIAILFVCHNVSDLKHKEKQLYLAERKYETLVNTLFEGVLMVNADLKIAACNARAAEILGVPEKQLLELENLLTANLSIIKKDGSHFPPSEFPAIRSLETGLPQRNVTMGIKKPGGQTVWLMVNSRPIINPGETKPYATVVSLTDISDKLNAEDALKLANDRLSYAGRVTSDAIWDLDLVTNQIYRSDAFNSFSGYNTSEIEPNLDWWFERTHPDDRNRVRAGIKNCIESGISNWQDEYRFQCADGNYRFLLDSAIILYKDGKAVRIIGAIQDLTERKRLEAKLIFDEIQKQKQLSQAAIVAQEKERNNISRELHDNVNQILISARLFMSTAQKDKHQQDELLAKAIEYQTLALEEIRKLSRSLSTSFVKAVGLKESLGDIVQNLQSFQDLDVVFKYNNRVTEKLSDDQKLMIFRVVQEQTSNILKYAHAKSVKILINETGGMVHLVISDDGIGFDAKMKPRGIGFVNIMNRADAYNGKVNIISSPGNGCTLELQFPVAAS